MSKQNVQATTNQKFKIEAINYEKSFEMFSDMIDELKTIHDEIDSIFQYSQETINEATGDLLDYFNSNAPDIINRTNLQTALSFSSNKASLKTNKFFAIKWRFKYDQNGFITNLVGGVTVFTRGNKDTDEIKDMIDYLNNADNGWKVVEHTVNKNRNNKNNNKEQ